MSKRSKEVKAGTYPNWALWQTAVHGSTWLFKEVFKIWGP